MKIAFLLFVTGLIAAPGYMYYTKYLTGKVEVQTSTHNTNGFTLNIGNSSVSDGEKFPTNSSLITDNVELSNTTNPYTIFLSIDYLSQSKMYDRAVFEVALLENSKVLWKKQRPFSIKNKKKDKKETISINRIKTIESDIGITNIPKSGNYNFKITRVDKQLGGLLVQNVELTVKSQIKSPNMKIVIAGVLMILLGIFFMLRRNSE